MLPAKSPCEVCIEPRWCSCRVVTS